MKRGRPKGYSPYIDIGYEELADWVGRKTKIPVSKKWLESLMGSSSEDFPLDKIEKPCDTDEVEAKIEYTLTNFENE